MSVVSLRELPMELQLLFKSRYTAAKLTKAELARLDIEICAKLLRKHSASLPLSVVSMVFTGLVCVFLEKMRLDARKAFDAHDEVIDMAEPVPKKKSISSHHKLESDGKMRKPKKDNLNPQDLSMEQYPADSQMLEDLIENAAGSDEADVNEITEQDDACITLYDLTSMRNQGDNSVTDGEYDNTMSSSMEMPDVLASLLDDIKENRLETLEDTLDNDVSLPFAGPASRSPSPPPPESNPSATPSNSKSVLIIPKFDSKIKAPKLNSKRKATDSSTKSRKRTKRKKRFRDSQISIPDKTWLKWLSNRTDIIRDVSSSSIFKLPKPPAKKLMYERSIVFRDPKSRLGKLLKSSCKFTSKARHQSKSDGQESDGNSNDANHSDGSQDDDGDFDAAWFEPAPLVAAQDENASSTSNFKYDLDTEQTNILLPNGLQERQWNVPTTSRQVASSEFYSILELKTKGLLNVRQPVEYADIFIERTNRA